MGELDKRVTIVTGAGRGIGFGIAKKLAAAGAIIIIAELDAESGTSAAEQLRADGYGATFVGTDVTDPESVQRLVDSVVERYGRIDILVNNAGAASVGHTESMPVQDWYDQIDVMCNGVFLCLRAAGAVMITQGKGVILNISSIAGLGAWPLRSAYDAAKAAVISLTENAGCEWARKGVRVVSVAPGVTRTNMLQQMVDEKIADHSQYEERAPMRRVAEVDEIANAVHFVVSDRAKYITATTVSVDGGWTAWGNLPL